MSLMVKICGMTDEAAVAAAVDSGADAIGFVFHERSPRNLTPERAAALATDVPDEILKVAVTLHPDQSLWSEVQDAVCPDVLQTDLGDFAELDVAPGMTRWPVVREGSVPSELPDTFVYEGRRSGHGETVDWVRAAEIATRGRMLLAGGLNADNIGEAIGRVRPWGVDVSSAVENRPGRKDVILIREFVAAARVAARQEETGE